MSDENRLLVKVATLYYKNRLTQNEIADRLGISRQSVGRILQRAQELGIVQIKIHAPTAYASDLEYLLETEFKLKEAIVVEPLTETDEAIKEAIGKAAADFIQRRLKSGDIIGLSWSTTVYQCALHMEPVNVRGVTVVGLNGSLNVTTYPTHAEFVIHRMAEACGGTPVLLAAPMFVDRPDIKQSLLTDSKIAQALALARQSNFAVFGIGDLSEQSSPFKAGYVTLEMLEHFKQRGVAGDICGRFIDINGNPCLSDIAERTIAVELEDLRKKPLSVGVAGGLRKARAILGALHGQFCNVLITDAFTAQVILELQGVQPAAVQN
ncbi:MAG: sugar-binding transcriptional regulator [Anaerolineae bacterium]|nr:sugar-binding transcriptional regulator [Anaerolineae bacterium]